MVSVIVVTYHSAAHVDACLHALNTQAGAGPYEIVVVDNASADGTPDLVRARHPSVRLIMHAENLGFAGGVNAGVRAAHGDRIALINPDAVAAPDWLVHLCAPLDNPSVGVVGSRVLGPDGRIQSLGAELREPVLLTAHRHEGAASQHYDPAPLDVWAVHGAAMAFPRALWQELGGLDEGYFPAYWEESDFCERARRAGRRVVVAPGAVVQHAEASALGKYSASFYFYYHRGRLRYATRWYGWDALWQRFRPAEQARLAQAATLDRRVARLAYQLGVPAADLPDAAARQAILQVAADLRSGALPDDGYGPLAALLDEAGQNSVLDEVRFTSSVPLVAQLRTSWNNVATRWYVRPSLDEQTRFNLATLRAMRSFAEQGLARAAGDALGQALLEWRLRALG